VGPPITGPISPLYDDPSSVVATPQFLPLLLIPDRGPRVARVCQANGHDVAVNHQQSEEASRGARLLRTAPGPAVARFLEHPAIVEVTLNPDGRLWVDRIRSAPTKHRPFAGRSAREKSED
jgi:hypothetical protein